ncbi:DnaD domain-containing protein [Streptococcus peroris]|uniref:DnaD domain-containing protein n=1 Tax=Streptococcus peroris TaxID=68891 RepID=UPI0039C4979F
MAQRRMFSRKITETDHFLEMPLSSQALYFHLNMGADDEGFIDKAKTIQRTIGASDDDMKLLIAKGFLIPFESGVVVIRHWRIHNYIQADRFQATIHQNEKEQLEFDKSKIASIKPLDQCIQNVSKLDTQVRLGEDRLDKDRLDKVNNLYSGENGKKSLSQIIKSSSVKINDRQIQQIQEYIGLDNMTVEMIEYAVQLTEDAGAESFNYLNKILKSWKDKGLTSLDEAKEETSGFRDSKNSTSKTRIVGNTIEHEYQGELPF